MTLLVTQLRLLAFATTITFFALRANAQCTWSTYIAEDFEYNTVIADIVPGTTYQNTPQTYAGCAHSGTYGMYLNIVNGYSGMIYDRPYTNLCVGQNYRFSFWTRDAFSSSNNLTFRVLDASNNVISSQNVINNNVWQNITMPAFIAVTANIRFQIITNIAGAAGNDVGVDQIYLAACSPTPSNYNLTQCSSLGNVDLYSQITSGLSINGNWTGPSALQNGSQGTFVAGTNTNGAYTYTIDGLGSCPDSIATVQVNLVNTPDFTPLGPISSCGPYTLPAITGTNLPGNQHYYTGTNGTGTMLNPGAVINTSQTLYIYGGSTGCTDQETVNINVFTPGNAGNDDETSYCSPGQTIDLNNFLSAGVTAGGTWAETTGTPSGTLNTSNGNWNTATLTGGGNFTFSYTIPANGACPSDVANFSFFIGSANGIDIGSDTTLCPGQTIDFSVPAGYDYFSWNVTSSNQTTITVSAPDTVILEVQTTTENLVINGDFEAGNTGFTTGYGPGTGGTWGLLSNASTYALTTNPHNVHNNFVNCADHTPTGPGNMMVVNGSTVPNTQVWGQVIGVNPNTNYNFSTWVTSVANISASDVAHLQFYINNVQIGPVFSPTLLGCDWQQFFETWNSGASTSASISIVAQNISGNNDFALDDITFSSVCIETDTVIVTYDQSTINAGNDIAFCANEQETLTATANFANPNFVWETTETSATISPATSGYYTVSTLSPNGCLISDSALVTVTPMPWNVDETGSQNTDCGVNNGAVYVTMTGTFNDPPSYTWNGPGANNPNEIDASVWQNLSSGWYYVSIESDGCYRYDSAYVDVNNPPTALLNANPNTGYTPLVVNFTNSSTNSTDFEWNFGNGNATTSNDLSGQTETFTTGTYVVFLVATQGNCSDTAFVTITVNDPPIVVPPVAVDLSYPNVFTPNGDQANDYFEFDLLNIKSIHIDILNRWGEVVFSSNDLNFKWDGTSTNSVTNQNEVTEGVYTFIYSATGAQDEQLDGQGFVHLIK